MASSLTSLLASNTGEGGEEAGVGQRKDNVAVDPGGADGIGPKKTREDTENKHTMEEATVDNNLKYEGDGINNVDRRSSETALLHVQNVSTENDRSMHGSGSSIDVNRHDNSVISSPPKYRIDDESIHNTVPDRQRDGDVPSDGLEKRECLVSHSAPQRRRLDNPGHAVEGNDDDNDNSNSSISSSNNGNESSNFKVTPGQGDIPPVSGFSTREQGIPRQASIGSNVINTRLDTGDAHVYIDSYTMTDVSLTNDNDITYQPEDDQNETLPSSPENVLDEKGIRNEKEIEEEIISQEQRDMQERKDVEHDNDEHSYDSTDETSEHKTEAASRNPTISRHEVGNDNFPDVYGDEPDGTMVVLASQIAAKPRENDDTSAPSLTDGNETSAWEEIAIRDTHAPPSLVERNETSGWMDGVLHDAMSSAIKSTTAIIHSGVVTVNTGEMGRGDEDKGQEVKRPVDNLLQEDSACRTAKSNRGPENAGSVFAHAVTEAEVHSSFQMEGGVMSAENHDWESHDKTTRLSYAGNSELSPNSIKLKDLPDSTGIEHELPDDSTKRKFPDDVKKEHLPDSIEGEGLPDSSKMESYPDSDKTEKGVLDESLDKSQCCDLGVSSDDGLAKAIAKSTLSMTFNDAVVVVDEFQSEKDMSDGSPHKRFAEQAEDWLVEWVNACGKVEKTRPLHKRLADHREKVLTQKTVKASGYVVLKNTRRKKIKQLSNFWSNVTYTLALWGRPIRKVEGVHGAGVASYFMFLRWLFGFNIFFFLFMGGFITVPMALVSEVELTASTDTVINTSYYCNLDYTVVEGSGVSVMLEFIQGSGWMEKTVLFYGYYVHSLQAAYNLPLAYILTVLGCLVISMILMARYTGNSLKEALLSSSNTSFEYSNKVFGAWDYSLTDSNAAELKMKGITYDIQSEMIEQAFMRKRIARLEKKCSKCWLYFLRLLVNVFIIASLGGAAYLIYYVTTWSTEYSAENADASGTESWLLLLVQYLPSLTITACNALLPIIFEKVVILEDYAQVFVIKLTLVRTVFLRLASLIVLVITLYTEINCTPKNSCNANQAPDCTNLRCWETYVGQQFYKLVIMDFLVAVVKVFVVELPRKFFTSRCKNKILEKIGPPEFNIPSNVLDLVYGECLVWLGFLFSPMLPGVVVLKCFILFYVKLVSALVACPPTERPYKASRINTFFMIILLVAFFLCTLPVVFTIFGIAPSKGCGPFRLLNYMNEAIKNDVETWPSVLASSYDFLTSAAVLVAVLIVLGIAVYYLNTMANAQKQKAELYKEQLIMEGRDKQFLLTKFQEMYSTPNKSNKAAKSDKKSGKADDKVALIDESGDHGRRSKPTDNVDW